ncbi:MAG TPA: hypothetical protein VMP08_12060, partial [Anaerolineae bacterium]|nr:hypothetical protein [Anaerolineae bacterium]
MRALCNLVNTLPSDQRGTALDEAIALARSIDQPWLRVRALAPILLRQPASQKTSMANEVLETIKLIPHEWHRGRALMLVAHGLPDEIKDRAVEIAQTIGVPYVRA